MKISIIGFSGFLGSELIKYLKKDKKIKLVKINSRDFSYSKINYFLLKKIFQSEVIINCAASLNPKNKNDIFINKHFPALLCSYNKFFRKRIIHISTVNVLIKDRMDLYSLSKRYGEDKILNNKNITILRLPFLFKKIHGFYLPLGNIKFFFQYLNINFLPFYPMIYPGHIYKPIEINNVLIFIKKIIFTKKIKKIYNIQGSKKKSLFDIFNEVALQLNKKTIKLNLILLNNYLPLFIKNFFKRKNSFLQQLVIIKNFNS
jgi:dTDP-4-dehydrorhamnose reductase